MREMNFIQTGLEHCQRLPLTWNYLIASPFGCGLFSLSNRSELSEEEEPVYIDIYGCEGKLLTHRILLTTKSLVHILVAGKN